MTHEDGEEGDGTHQASTIIANARATAAAGGGGGTAMGFASSMSGGGALGGIGGRSIASMAMPVTASPFQNYGVMKRDTPDLSPEKSAATAVAGPVAKDHKETVQPPQKHPVAHSPHKHGMAAGLSGMSGPNFGLG